MNCRCGAPAEKISERRRPEKSFPYFEIVWPSIIEEIWFCLECAKYFYILAPLPELAEMAMQADGKNVIITS